MSLLNRKVKRKSSWTPQAMLLAQTYQLHQRRLDQALKALHSSQIPKQISIGTLEGLAELAGQHVERLFAKFKMEMISLDVFDRTELEAKFLAGELDVIFNTRLPSRTKPKYVHVCGYQTLDQVEKGLDYQVYSTFEFNLRPRKAKEIFNRTLVSNSLAVRRAWLERIGGHGTLPSAISDKAKKGADEVLLVGGEWVDPRLWDALISGM